MSDFKQEFSTWNVRLYHISLLLLLASIPLSKYTTSAAQFLILALWLFYQSDLDYIADFNSSGKPLYIRILRLVSGFLESILKSLYSKFKSFFHCRAALILPSLLVLHVIGLLYTSDFSYALKDLRTKLPLFLLPLFFSTGPKVNTRTLYWLYFGYAAAILAGTIYRIYLFLNLPVADTREIHSHISHIRFSLNTVYCIFILLYFIFLKGFLTRWQKILIASVVVWFTFFLLYLSYSTGISILVIVSILFMIYKSLIGSDRRKQVIFLATGLVLLAAPLLYFHSVVEQYRHTEPVNYNKLDRYTTLGNIYRHDTIHFKVENGKYVGLYICDEELDRMWSKASRKPLTDLDGKKQLLKNTLIRYLASKDLRKDSSGVAQLTPKDIGKIEAGLTHANNSALFDIRTPIENLLVSWDNYKYHNNPNSSSLIQRLEYWKASILLLKEHPLIGVGTGDVPTAFELEYKRMNSLLDPQYRLRAHNQYLSIAVAFGILGLCWFLFVLVYPTFAQKGYKDYFYIIFWLILIISMFTEDTIESQEGVTYFAYFASLLLLARDRNETAKAGD
ncbi:MAG: O-antigen ligase family protein [Bacteroidetes bacterium]|nr:O-antigen ligase family protein [Bacteroidota bacterium]